MEAPVNNRKIIFHYFFLQSFIGFFYTYRSQKYFLFFLSGYDAHFIIKEIATAYNDGNVDLLPKTKETFHSLNMSIAPKTKMKRIFRKIA